MTAEEIILTIAESAKNELGVLRRADFSDGEIAMLGSISVYIDAEVLLEIERFAKEWAKDEAEGGFYQEGTWVGT